MPARAFYGYHIIAACFAIQALFLGTLFSFGVIFPELEAEFGWSRTTISGASSLAFLLMGLLAVVMGRVNDRVGPRTLLAVSGVLLGLGYLLMYWMEAVWQLYLLYGVLLGAGLSAHDVATLSTVARWFVRRRGLMSGVIKAGGGAGQMLVPIAAAALVSAYSWRIACLVIGAAGLVVIVGAAQWLRRDPGVLGQRADGAREEPDAPPAAAEAGLGLRAAARHREFWVLCAAKFADLFCLLTVIVHIVPHGIDQGLAPATAARVLATIGGISILGRLVLGGGYDRFRAKRALAACFALLLVSLLVLQAAAAAWTFFAFAILYGIAHGGFFTVASPAVAEYFGTRSHGAIFGAVYASGTLGGTVGPMVTGWIFDTTGSYDAAFLLLTGFSALGLVLASLLGPSRLPAAGGGDWPAPDYGVRSLTRR